MVLMLIALFGASLILSSCTAREQGAVIGTGVGAASGLAIGKRTSGAFIGGAGGALLGALTGEVVERHREAKAQERRISELEQQQRVQQRAEGVVGPAIGVDPTAGEILNDTKWVVNVYVDDAASSTKRAPTMVLMPRETKAFSMDIGQHRVMAEAFVSTQYGQRFVGKYDQVLNIDPKSSGWRIRFGESSFN